MYPRETFEALQQTPMTLCSMIKYFRNMIRKSPISTTPMFPVNLSAVATTAISIPRPSFPLFPLQMRMHSVAQSRKNFPHLFQNVSESSEASQVDQLMVSQKEKAESQVQQGQFVSNATQVAVNFPHRSINWTPNSFIEQPRYPPLGTYIQTIRPAGRKVCYSCGITGHGAEFCPNINMPVCYGCKEIGHKRPQCTKQWAWQRSPLSSFSGPVQQGASLPLIQALPVGPETAPKTAGIFLSFNSVTSPSTYSNVFVLDTGATHHVVNSPKLLLDFVSKPYKQSVYLPDTVRSLSILGYGTLSFTVANSPGQDGNLLLSEVLMCPYITINIISVHRLCQEKIICQCYLRRTLHLFLDDRPNTVG